MLAISPSFHCSIIKDMVKSNPLLISAETPLADYAIVFFSFLFNIPFSINWIISSADLPLLSRLIIFCSASRLTRSMARSFINGRTPIFSRASSNVGSPLLAIFFASIKASGFALKSTSIYAPNCALSPISLFTVPCYLFTVPWPHLYSGFRQGGKQGHADKGGAEGKNRPFNGSRDC